MIKTLQGITINLSNNQEMVLHVSEEPDIRFMSQRRKTLIDTLKVIYLEHSKFKNENLPIYGIKATSLAAFEKTQNDCKKGIETKEPEEHHRLEEEDLVKMNLDEAICELSEHSDEKSDNSSSGIEIKEESKQTVNFIDINEMG